ncbi:MAG: Nif3-like dinuclear metal center hexameric protein [Eubacteriales bacterium]|nr:Nif3-like dinuclear metal center hexameric protein [Eubacteriales bacterium]
MKVIDAYNAINEFAPFKTAESYDNVGILAGNPEAYVTKALIALDCSEEVLDEAIELGAELIITHHPIIFNPVKQVLADDLLYKIINSRIAVISAHTNLDMAHCGVNDALAKKLELTHVENFDITNRKNYNKIIAFVPRGYAEKVRQAMCSAGAGSIGNDYVDCAFRSEGIGCFKPVGNANPFIGEVDKMEYTDEIKVEVICHRDITAKVVEAMVKVHPYEVPAYDIFEDEALADVRSIGRIGKLRTPMTAEKLASFAKDKLGCKRVAFVNTGDKDIFTIAICGGAGGSLLELAKSKGAGAYITSEIKHNIWLDAKRYDIALMDCGHYNTERVVLEPLKEILDDKFKDINFKISETEQSVIDYI